MGYVHELKEKGIDDPIQYFQAEVDQLNAVEKANRNADKTRQIGEIPQSVIWVISL